MIKSLQERLGYACIGFVLGAIAAVGLWYFFGLGFSRHHTRPPVDADLFTWVKYVGGFFAAVGFVFRDRVGDAVGGTARAVHDHETRGGHSNPDVPRWLALAVLAGVAAAVWYFKR